MNLSKFQKLIKESQKKNCPNNQEFKFEFEWLTLT